MSPSRVKLLELMGAIEKDGRFRKTLTVVDEMPKETCTPLAEDISMSSLEALLPDDLEKHVQLNRARLNFIWCLERRDQNILCV